MAKAPTARLAATIYTREDALIDASETIDPVETGDPTVILAKIIVAIQDAASGRKAESLHLRQRDPATGIVTPIPTNHPNWIALRNTLLGAPYNYTVTVRANIGDIEIKWAS